MQHGFPYVTPAINDAPHENGGRRADAQANDEKVVQAARRLAGKDGHLPPMQAIAAAAAWA